jgi:hypothetical protein
MRNVIKNAPILFGLLTVQFILAPTTFAEKVAIVDRGGDRLGYCELDAKHIIEAIDITPNEWSDKNTRLIHLMLYAAITIQKDISAYPPLPHAHQVDVSLKEITFRISTAHSVENPPDKQRAKANTGPIEITETQRRGSRFKIGLGAQADGDVVNGKAEMSIDIYNENGSTKSYEKYADKPVVVSGNFIEGGNGLTITLKAKSTFDITGQHILSISLEVPKDFKADYLRIASTAHVSGNIHPASGGCIVSDPSRVTGEKINQIKGEAYVGFYLGTTNKSLVENFNRTRNTRAVKPVLKTEYAQLTVDLINAEANLKNAKDGRGFWAKTFNSLVDAKFRRAVTDAQDALDRKDSYVSNKRACTIIRSYNGLR